MSGYGFLVLIAAAAAGYLIIEGQAQIKFSPETRKAGIIKLIIGCVLAAGLIGFVLFACAALKAMT